ncbi:hypothetical protein BD770DRAFT_411541 [Pilaira anomala]|nr:hypothetical protein BD770DRAFT_411541 [Pilaira anomala]
MNEGFIFSCQVIPGVWNNTTEKLFSDGLGRKDGFEVIIMESSGPYSTENIDHSVEDTSKLIILTTNSLRNEILQYQETRILHRRRMINQEGFKNNIGIVDG